MRKFLRSLYINLLGNLKSAKPGVHIINAHFISDNYISDSDEAVFDSFMKFLTSNYTLITLEEATSKIINGNLPIDKVYIALTFDDGFEECYTVIAPIIEKYNCRAAFFINANYINSNLEYQTGFNKRVNINCKKPMSWEQVSDLHERGHLIGSHNLDHLNMGVLTVDELDFQVRENKEILERNLSYSCNYFAWTYGHFKHFPPEALDITLKYHDYIYSATHFKKYLSMNGRVLNRRQIEPFWPKSHVNFFLSFKKEF